MIGFAQSLFKNIVISIIFSLYSTYEYSYLHEVRCGIVFAFISNHFLLHVRWLEPSAFFFKKCRSFMPLYFCFLRETIYLNSKRTTSIHLTADDITSTYYSAVPPAHECDYEFAGNICITYCIPFAARVLITSFTSSLRTSLRVQNQYSPLLLNVIH